ncbi:Quinate dehydrogenase [Venturia inaequalis]|nr:Quinate dehydrogenase [Venturia inaequalis]
MLFANLLRIIALASAASASYIPALEARLDGNNCIGRLPCNPDICRARRCQNLSGSDVKDCFKHCEVTPTWGCSTGRCCTNPSSCGRNCIHVPNC